MKKLLLPTVLWFLGGLLVACQPAALPPTPSPTPSPTLRPTATVMLPQIMCTAPVCDATQGALTCGDPAGCPGGCGTICATYTPMAHQVNPTVYLTPTAITLQVGEVLTLTGRVVDIGLPYYEVRVRDAGQAEFDTLIRLTYDNQIKLQEPVSQIFSLVTEVGGYADFTVVLMAQTAGESEIFVNVTGEIHEGYPGPAYWGGAASETLRLTVTP